MDIADQGFLNSSKVNPTNLHTLKLKRLKKYIKNVIKEVYSDIRYKPLGGLNVYAELTDNDINEAQRQKANSYQ